MKKILIILLACSTFLVVGQSKGDFSIRLNEGMVYDSKHTKNDVFSTRFGARFQDEVMGRQLQAEIFLRSPPSPKKMSHVVCAVRPHNSRPT